MIRNAIITDAGELSLLINSLTHYYLDGPDSVMPNWLFESVTEVSVKSRLENPEYSNYVFMRNEELAGYISFKGKSHLLHLFVKEKYQGNGYARQLWQHALEHGICFPVTVRSSIYAVPVYKRFGFNETGPSENKDGLCYQPMIFKA